MGIALLLLLISLAASTVGAITGIGGGVIVKPTVDALGVATVSTVSFLSGIMVLTMAAASLWRGRKQAAPMDARRVIVLAVGAALGGVGGKLLFDLLKARLANPGALGVIQNAILLLLTIGVFCYTLAKQRVHTHHLSSPAVVLACGLTLGLISAFLGIGGGPINLLALSFLFSLDAKAAARHSIFIILFSQIANLLLTLLTGTVPPFEPLHLCMMMLGGVSGALLGSKIVQRLNVRGVDNVFLGLLLVICFICVSNIVRFAA